VQLHTIWFVIVAFFWVGFFVLEGFDFGVGMLHTIVGKTDAERQAALDTIGPFWDGNEVWLVVAGAGTFAAFPVWYATMFSALYLALLIVLIALMARGVAFGYKDKSDNPRWQRTWTWCTSIGSLLVPLLIGIGLGDLLVGLPINSSQDFSGNFFDLLTGYGIWTGLTLVGLCLLHGATFIKLKSTDGVRDRARALTGPLGWAATVLVIGFVVWTIVIANNRDVPDPIQILAVLAVIFAARLAVSEHHDGAAFTASTIAIAAVIGSIFINLYPNVMVSSTNSAYNLTVNNSASGSYALKVMTIVAILFVPLVIAYQGWSFHVFRARVKAPATADQTNPDPPVVPPIGPASVQ
jgi:cytochrome d ubiquinol oxidase subunit II